MTENKLNQMPNCDCADKSSAPPEGLAFSSWLIQHGGVPLQPDFLEFMEPVSAFVIDILFFTWWDL